MKTLFAHTQPTHYTPLALWAAAGLLVAVSTVHAQNFITNQGGWTFPAAVADITQSGNSAILNGERAVRGGLARFSFEGGSVEDRDGAATADNLRVRYNVATNILTMGLAGDIVVPALTDGKITFFGANNRSQARVISTVQLYREDTAGLEDWTLIDTQTFNSGLFDRNAGAAAVENVSNTLVARFANQAAGARRYAVDVRLDVQTNANGGVPGAPGVGGLDSGVVADFHTVASNRGAFYSVSAEPTAYTGNSRAAVDAVEAQTRYGVNGLLARGVGVLETGRVKAGHADLAGRMFVLNGGGGEEYETEHSLAVAGIIGARNADTAKAGVAPRVDLYSVSAIDHGGVIAGATALRGQFGAGNAGIINMSATGGATPEQVDTFVNANPNITWVASVGNDAIAHNVGRTYLGDVPNPSYARNNIAVGALDSDFTTAADYSSTSLGLYPAKPDVVAPGSYILSTGYRDTNNNNAPDDYTRSFLGANYKREFNATVPMSVNTGPISGTSFAAPHVSGAVALLHDYSARNAGFDNRSMDHRVMKALIVGGAKTAGIVDQGGLGWQQAGNHPQQFTTFGDAISVTRSLDRDFGGGILSASGSLSMYAGGEALLTDNNAAAQHRIDLRDGSSIPHGRNSFWDLETVAAQVGGTPGTVDYFLGGTLLSIDNIIQGFSLPASYIRVALTWDITLTGGAYDPLANLELLVYADGFQAGNVAGFDPRAGRGNDDYLIAKTQNIDENVKLLDFSLATLYFFSQEIPFNFRPNLYIEVRNLSASAVTYGIATSFVAVPAPAALTSLVIAGLFAGRRRRVAVA